MSPNPIEPDTNEAELQHRFADQLRNLLPLLPVSFRLERHLHLRLGHKDILINGVPDGRQSVSGRYDLLVCVDGKPVIMVEFKKPGNELTSEDHAQGLSYARLHEPPVPLTFISNGSQSHLLYTSNGDAVEPTNQQAGALTALLAKAASLASAPAAHTIDILLGTSPAIWQALCRNWSEQHLERLSGPIQTFQYPLVPGYSIPREVCFELQSKHSEGAGFLLLHGPPLAGVTNTLAQFARAYSDAPMLFVDTHRWPNVLQFLANTLSQEIEIDVSLDKLRHWLNARQGLAGLTLILDGVPAEGFEELIDFARRKLLRLVVGMSTASYQRVQTRGGRIQAGLLSEADAVIALTPFTDRELHAAERVLLKFNFSFQPGVAHSHELRWPRALRVIVATVAQTYGIQALDSQSSDAQRGHIELSGIPGLGLLAACQRAFEGQGQQLSDMRRVAKAYLHELEQNVNTLNPALTQSGVYSIASELAEETLGEPRQARLVEHGLLSWQDNTEGPPRLRVQLEELLAHHIADEWADQLRAANQFAAALERLLNLTTRCPLPAITLAAAIFRASKSDLALRGQAAQTLLERSPHIALLGPPPIPSGPAPFELKKLTPWLVLSYLAFEDFEPPLDHLQIFASMGAFPALLHLPSRPEAKSVESSYQVYQLRDGRLIPCPKNGILEPLQQAILYRSQLYPPLLTALAEASLQTENPFLAGRVITVATHIENSKRQDISEAAKIVLTHLSPWFHEQLIPANETA